MTFCDDQKDQPGWELNTTYAAQRRYRLLMQEKALGQSEAKKRRRARLKARKREEELTAKAAKKLASRSSDPCPPHPSTIPRPTASAPSAHVTTRTAIQPANSMGPSSSGRNTIIIPPRPLPSSSSPAPRGVRRPVEDQPVSRRVRAKAG
ncbi:hypothetical protein BDZ89DRAFT_1049956 [Hymenopellis radicata]|nr:hypothetical protein BDZ89DRAFT_1049956 [Hymenopellis radicata]